MSSPQSPAELSTFRLRRRTPGSFILVPCPQEGRSIRCQGHLEADAALILSACPCVARIQEQPLAIWYAWQATPQGFRIRLLSRPPERKPRSDDPVCVSYIVPDFLVSMVDGRQYLVEVKPSRRLDRPRVQRKLAVAQLFAQRQGWVFNLLTERELRTGPLLANLHLIRRYLQLRPDARLATQLELRVPESGVRIGDLLLPAGETSSRYQHILHMLSLGQLTCAMHASPLDQQILLFPKGAIVWDPFVSLWAPSGCSASGPSGSSASSPATTSSPST
jgi:hypothetical protein